jgi:hypothetical protein
MRCSAAVEESVLHTFGECGEGVAVPFLEEFAGQRLTGGPALVGQDGELADRKVWVFASSWGSGIGVSKRVGC